MHFSGEELCSITDANGKCLMQSIPEATNFDVGDFIKSLVEENSSPMRFNQGSSYSLHRNKNPLEEILQKGQIDPNRQIYGIGVSRPFGMDDIKSLSLSIVNSMMFITIRFSNSALDPCLHTNKQLLLHNH